MIEVFKYEKRYWYPHMKPQDIEIWERFIAENPDAYDTCEYDFAVGDAPPFNPLADDGTDLNQDVLYRLKIDVVGKKGGKVDIIELKPSASASTIGQVEGYRDLYLRDTPGVSSAQPVIITDFLRPNMDYLCQQKGVKIVVV